MCTAYEIGQRGESFPAFVKARALADLLRAHAPSIVRPTHGAPVILPDGSALLMTWGFRRNFSPTRPGGTPRARTIVNSRSDKLASPMWRDAYEKRRCLIPAEAYFEWTRRRGRAVPLRFTQRDSLLLWIAGIWEESDSSGRCFSMITTEPNAQVSPVHDRMPAVLEGSQLLPFLHGDLPPLHASGIHLDFAETPNFLKKPTNQQELF